MKHTTAVSPSEFTEPKRKLSIVRVIIATVIVCLSLYVIVTRVHRWEEQRSVESIKPWFSAYVDVTSTPRYPFEQIAENQQIGNLVLSFIVGSSKDQCVPTWGNAYTLDEAQTSLDLERRIARYRQQGGEIAVSFGGLLNKELAYGCTDETRLKQAYEQVIDRYTIDTIDLDIEGDALKDKDSLDRRARVITAIQKERRSSGKSLAVWITIPVSTQGMTDEGANAVLSLLTQGVDISGVNGMTMNYGGTLGKNESIASASKRAVIETHRQLGVLFKQVNLNLNDITVWSKIGATVMIGQNDIAGEIFTLTDAEEFNKFAVEKRITRLSYWSANRDIECGKNYVNTSIVSDSCSGIKQEQYAFAEILGKTYTGNISQNASRITVEDPIREILPDDPQNSPYQIWSETGVYLAGTKVVWHQNVYQAKWWTQGDLPDNPVLQSWQTPWELLGPVLPGEKPVPQPTLPEGTYPVWSGKDIYDTGDRVLFNGTPYQAKWWTQGDSPAASTSNPDSSPWVPLTLQQVQELLLKLPTPKKSTTVQ